MWITNAAKTLLFEQQQFFQKESFSGHLALPALLTLLYAGIAAVCTSGGNIFGMITSAALILIAWVVVAALFYVSVKMIGHAACTYPPILAATGYASVPFLIGTVITGAAGATVGGFSTTLTALMTVAVLIWCIPIWVYAIAAVTGLPAKTVLHLLIVPILLILVVELWSTFAAGTPLASGISGGSSMGETGVTTAGPGGSTGSGSGMSVPMSVSGGGPAMSGGGPGPR